MANTSKPSLAETHPELAAQADGWDPKMLTAGSNRKVGWKCDSGHRWTAIVINRTKGRGCPICAGKKVLVGFNDLATTNPEMAREADGWDPTSVRPGSNKRFRWKCQTGHTWTATPNNRSNGTNRCPVCSGHKLLAGFNDLATTNPELAAQADGWDPTTLLAGSGKVVGWICKFGHKWNSNIDNRSKGNGCPVCSGNKVQAGFNDLATTNPELATQADGWDPTTLSAGSSRKVRWKCELGHGWNAQVANRSLGDGCPVCSGRKVQAGFNDLATTNPELAALADGWDPTTVTTGSNIRVKWKCEFGHKSVVPVNQRSQYGCPVCSGHKVLAGFNDLATTNLELAAQADGWDPTTLSAGSSRKVRWKCELGHTWNANIASRAAGRGCPSCAKFGFDPNQPGFIYFIDHFKLDMFQIGITNFPDKRLDQHGRSGWEVIELRGPMDGQLTRQLETNCLHALEKRGAILGHKAGIDKFDGYSEAWTKASLNVTSIKQILDWVYEDETK
jgi:Zn finger protein HypA/HybF involved in hydrogenase expression